MNTFSKYTNIQAALLKWYDVNKRDLPWRHTSDPYIIWISEVILQQTRVDQGHDYFMRFVDRFPNVQVLAQADEEDVLRLWQGLGYYSRARNLHAAAKDVVSRFGGVFPQNYKDVLSLKGIGEYTAAAIVSFAYGQPYAVVDGNVYRVLSRFFGIADAVDSSSGKKIFAALAQDILNKEKPDMHNQAIMEMGALQCVPVNPVCESCPLNDYCVACATNAIKAYPVKQGKTKVKERFFNYIDIRVGEYIYLNKRTGNDVWKNLYELPLIETEEAVDWSELKQTLDFKVFFGEEENMVVDAAQIKLKHVLSHRIIYASFYRVTLQSDLPVANHFIKIKQNELHQYPISRLVDRYFESIL